MMKVTIPFLFSFLVAAGLLASVLADPDAFSTLTESGGLLTLRITNNNPDEDLYVLNEALPPSEDGPLFADLFQVTKDGSEVAYRGYRGFAEPSEFPDDYFILAPQEEFEITLNILRDSTYDFSAGGQHDVTYNFFYTDLACDPTGSSCLDEIISSTVSIEAMRRNRRDLETRTTSVLQTNLFLPSEEQNERRLNPNDTYDAKCALHMALIDKARKAAIPSVEDACHCLDQTSPARPDLVELFECNFGEYNDANKGIVSNKFRGIKADLDQGINFKCANDEEFFKVPFRLTTVHDYACNIRKWIAYVDTGRNNCIFFCPAFFTFKENKKATRKGIIIHEVSHFPWPNPIPFLPGAGTDDYAYGKNVKIKLTNEIAKSDAKIAEDHGKARCNADSYRLFVECLPNRGRGGVWGDPHFATWRGNPFDFHGQCDLVLLHAPDFGFGMGLDVHIRTKIRYDYSYIESAAIQVGSDFLLEVSGFGQHFLNGVYAGDLHQAIAHEPFKSDINVTHEQRNTILHWTLATASPFESRHTKI